MTTTTDNDDRIAGYKLIESGTLVNFDILSTQIDESPGGDEAIVRIELHLGEVEEDDYRTEDHEWGGLGFMFALAVLSFADARPRGYTDKLFIQDDSLSLADFLDGFRYERGSLRWSGDYIRGRRMKTDITIRPDGKATLQTHGRGEAATRWVARLKGKKMLEVVGNEPAAPAGE